MVEGAVPCCEVCQGLEHVIWWRYNFGDSILRWVFVSHSQISRLVKTFAIASFLQYLHTPISTSGEMCRKLCMLIIDLGRLTDLGSYPFTPMDCRLREGAMSVLCSFRLGHFPVSSVYFLREQLTSSQSFAHSPLRKKTLKTRLADRDFS